MYNKKGLKFSNFNVRSVISLTIDICTSVCTWNIFSTLIIIDVQKEHLIVKRVFTFDYFTTLTQAEVSLLLELKFFIITKNIKFPFHNTTIHF